MKMYTFLLLVTVRVAWLAEVSYPANLHQEMACIKAFKTEQAVSGFIYQNIVNRLASKYALIVAIRSARV